MTSSEHSLPVIDVHVHVHPHAAETFLKIMDANNLSRVVNLGTLERVGFPFAQGMHTYQRVFGERLVYFTIYARTGGYDEKGFCVLRRGSDRRGSGGRLWIHGTGDGARWLRL